MNGNPVTILLVEDDPGHARLIEKNIRRAGVNNAIVHVADGTTALDRLAGPLAHAPLLVLLDLNLPDMSGTEILSRIKDDPALRAVPVVVLTTTRPRSPAATSSAAMSTSPSRCSTRASPTRSASSGCSSR